MSLTRSDSGLTKHGEPYVQLSVEDSGLVILKAYVSPDGEKIRIVLPELHDYTQTLIDPTKRLLEFDRQSKRRLHT